MSNKNHYHSGFYLSRELGRQSTRPRLKNGNLIDSLPAAERAHAIAIQRGKGFLSQIVDGIDAGELGSKVIIALAQTLYEQSVDANTTKELLGLSDQMQNLFPEYDFAEKFRNQENKIRMYPNGGKRDSAGNRTASPSPYIWFELSKFTRRVLGLGNKKPESYDKNNVAKTLRNLSDKVVYLAVDDNTHVGASLCSIEYITINKKTKSVIYIVRLGAIFTREVMKDKIILRNDTLVKLNGRQGDLTMRLLWYLAEQRSYHKQQTWPKDSIEKSKLMDMIAILPSYKKTPSRKEVDLKKAVEKMKYVGIIEDSDEGYTEKKNDKGITICTFKFNEDYLKE